MDTTQVLPPHLLKQFGVFVGLYNRTNGTRLTVKAALRQIAIVTLFESSLRCLHAAHDESVQRGTFSGDTSSTRRRSLDKINTRRVDSSILNLVTSTPGLSRKQLSEKLKMRLQTVCGGVSRLLEDDLIYVCGESLDHETNRRVETLAAK